MAEFHVVIPARFGSSRLPGKVLADIAGQPMLYWVWQRALAAEPASVVVATDDARIRDVMEAAGADVVMTAASHPSGTDRLAEVCETRGWGDDTVVVNLQGDEPLMPPENLRQAAEALAASPGAAIATLCHAITSLDEFRDPAAVKVVCDAAGNALYFSRAPIPWPRDHLAADDMGTLPSGIFRHVGLYAYRVGFLRRFVELPPAPLEILESLEQLRALYHGETIRVVEAGHPVPPGVDTEADLAAVRDQLIP